MNKYLTKNNLEGFVLALVLGPSVMAGKTVTEADGLVEFYSQEA